MFPYVNSIPVLNEPGIIWSPQLPIFTNWCSSISSMFLTTLSFKHHAMGPSIEIWMIFDKSNSNSDLLKFSRRSPLVVCPRNWESQYLTSTCFCFLTPEADSNIHWQFWVDLLRLSSMEITKNLEFCTFVLRRSLKWGARPQLLTYFNLSGQT